MSMATTTIPQQVCVKQCPRSFSGTCMTCFVTDTEQPRPWTAVAEILRSMPLLASHVIPLQPASAVDTLGGMRCTLAYQAPAMFVEHLMSLRLCPSSPHYGWGTTNSSPCDSCHTTCAAAALSAGKPPFDKKARDGLVPLNEVYTLPDYRLRHQNAKSDRALQEMQRRVPLIAIW